MAPVSAPPDARDEPAVVSHSGGLPVAFSLEPFASFDASQIVVEPVEPVDALYGRFGARCLVLRGALSPEECRYLIAGLSAEPMEQVAYRSDYRLNDRLVYESAPLAEVLWSRVRHIAESLAVHADPQHPETQRLADGERAAADGPPADCPEELRLPYGQGGLWRPTGLNECLRFCRYNPGGFFRAHCDAIFRRSDEEMSLFTCMFYLDGGGSFAGGATRFLKLDCTLTDENYLKLAKEDQVLTSLAPEAGMCLLFFQPGLLHEGEDVLEGSKHILRTDVMFRREPGTGPSRTPQEQEAWLLVQEAAAAEAAFECDKAAQLYRRAFKLDPKLERAF